MALNKMFVMIPVMLAARKLDGENPDTVFLLRCAYGAVQTLIVLIVTYIYLQAQSSLSGKQSDQVIYVPPPATPFADPNAKTKYTESKYGAHVASTARSLVGSTLFGIAMTVGLHWYKGMILGLAIQTVMGPLSLIENPLAKCILIGGGLKGAPEKKIFGEKSADELSADDEVVDEAGNAIVRRAGRSTATKKDSDEKAQSFEDILLDTWDAGAEADIGPLMAALNKKNINYKTAESSWTPIMIMSGLGAKKCGSALRQMKALGADPAIVDGEGWNALHWAAFHGSADAAKILLSEADYDGLKLGLDTVKDKEGKTALDHARAEGNDDVAKMIEDSQKVAKASVESTAQDEGLRKRK